MLPPIINIGKSANTSETITFCTVSACEPKEVVAKTAPATTSWGGVAEWYDNYLETNKDSYQEKVIAPNILRILDIKINMKLK